jgi:hypothetical protein
LTLLGQFKQFDSLYTQAMDPDNEPVVTPALESKIDKIESTEIIPLQSENALKMENAEDESLAHEPVIMR